MEPETVPSIRGNNKILLNGYVYVKQKLLANNVISYECERRRGKGIGMSQCKAKVKLNSDLSVVGYLNEHSHAADDARVEVLKVRENIKRRAEQTDETPQQILGQELQQLSQGAAVQMVPLRHVRRYIRLHKQTANAVHPVPPDRAFDIPEEYKTLGNGERFILFDSGSHDTNRIIVFGTDRSVNILKESAHWYMDGTFSRAGAVFQLYTVSQFQCYFFFMLVICEQRFVIQRAFSGRS